MHTDTTEDSPPKSKRRTGSQEIPIFLWSPKGSCSKDLTTEKYPDQNESNSQLHSVVKSTVILSCYLCLSLPDSLIMSGCPNKEHAFIFSLLEAK
jgi:hypothetical protein